MDNKANDIEDVLLDIFVNDRIDPSKDWLNLSLKELIERLESFKRKQADFSEKDQQRKAIIADGLFINALLTLVHNKYALEKSECLEFAVYPTSTGVEQALETASQSCSSLDNCTKSGHSLNLEALSREQEQYLIHLADFLPSALDLKKNWDLGYNDSTAIWLFQQCGQEIHLLDYYENSGEALTHYLQFLKNKPYTYGKHLVPHDAAVHEYSTGLSRVEVAKSHGVLFTITPDIGVIEGIDAARNILLRCWFDEEKCSKGIAALESYRKEWNDQLGCWSSRPLHNFASHGADAFRMLSVGFGKLENKGLTAAEWQSLRAKYIVS